MVKVTRSKREGNLVWPVELLSESLNYPPLVVYGAVLNMIKLDVVVPKNNSLQHII
jgi:hypothetical protein